MYNKANGPQKRNQKKMGTDPERYRERKGDRQRAIWGTNSDDPNLQRGINPPMGHRLWPDKKQKPDLKTRNLYQGKLAELSHKRTES